MGRHQAAEWIESAERDHETVAILTASPRVPYEIVAYHCQQCAEKYLKAIYVQHGRKWPFVHDLLRLNKGVQDTCPQLRRCETECERLSPFGTATRYPGGLMQVGPEHIPQLVGWMDAIVRVVRTSLGIEEGS